MPVTGKSTTSELTKVSRGSIADRLGMVKGALGNDCSELPLVHTFEIEQIDLLAWLNNCSRSPRFYWSSKDGSFEIGGYGVAMSIESDDYREPVRKCFDQVEKVCELCDDPNVRFVGGCRFDVLSQRDHIWWSFPDMRFAVPEISVQRLGGQYSVCVAVTVTEDSTLDQIASRIDQAISRINLDAPSVREPELALIKRTDYPAIDGWDSTIQTYLNLIESRRIEKVVAARRSDFRFADAVHPVAFLGALLLQNRNCSGFLIEPIQGQAFIGASPERLFKLQGATIEAEAVSGTIARGNTRETIGSAGRNLLSSDKNVREHRFVLEDVAAKLGQLCSGPVLADDLSLLKLSHVMHLHAKMSGELRAEISIGDVISKLHPTPAVGGVERDAALEVIRDHEPFDRGWYAAPIGIISRGYTEMTVAIRSALVVDKVVSLFVGAGIVEGSESRSEWTELEHKISPALKLLGGVLV